MPFSTAGSATPAVRFAGTGHQALWQTADVLPPAAPLAVDIRDLRKSYGDVEAVRDLSLTVARGELVALLGPNGAGKTTTLEVVEGLRDPDAGSVRVLGLSPQRARRRVGVQLQEGALYEELTCREILGFFARLYGYSLDAERLLQLTGLAGLGGRRTGGLSGGQKRRLQLALALCNDPDLVILDEPTTGLDPQSRRETWALVRQLHEEGRTLLLTTHYIEEAEALASRVVIVDQGQVIAQGSPAALIAELGGAVTVSVLAPAGAALGTLAGVDDAAMEGDRWRLRTGDAGAVLTALTARLGQAGLRGVTVQGPTLEDVFLARTGRHIATGTETAA